MSIINTYRECYIMGHFKIDPNLLDENKRLISKKSWDLVAQIEFFVSSLKEYARDLEYLQALFTQNQYLIDLANNPKFIIEQNILPQDQEVPAIYRKRVLEKMQDLLNQTKSDDTKRFFHDIIQRFSQMPLTDELFEQYSDILDEVWEKNEANAQDALLRDTAEKANEGLNAKIDSLREQMASKIAQYKKANDIIFDLDEQYQLIKIHKNSMLPYSVIYAKTSPSAASKAFALYPGKEGRVLGQGAFGRVKLCQDIHSGEWFAVKIQEFSMQGENEALRYLNRFKGALSRLRKNYSVQNLIMGVDLRTHLDTHAAEDLATRLGLAKKVVALVDEFHKLHFLHCDLKPENFMLGEDNTLSLIDFGMSRRVEDNQEGFLAESSGTKGFLAPELNDSSHMVLFTKKSDIYALGKMLEILFKGIEGTPQDINDLIKKMTAPDPEKREGSMERIWSVLEKINLDEDELPHCSGH